MREPRACSECRSPILSEALGELCPHCLLRLGLEAAQDPPPAAETATHPPGGSAGCPRIFGDYELEEEIARGGMGVVWRARQVSLGRPVALKLILAGAWASELEIQRFLREAQAAATLDHPNIVPIYEVGEQAGQHYFSMRLVEGRSLAARIVDPNTPLSTREAATLLAKVARAVHHAHQRGVLHRDLKPANILLDADGEPSVTDFGLAKQVNAPGEMTRSETVLGTANYISPEQAQGRNQNLTTATDLFSLGAVLYHLLTGRTPFQAPTLWETLRLVVEQEPARPGTLNRQVDRDLETICLKCLEKDPARRYGSAAALADDLERWLRQEPIAACPSTRLQRAGKWVRRKPLTAGLIATVVLVSLTGLGGIIGAWRLAVAAQKATEQQYRLARAAEEDAREKLLSSYLAQARALRWSGRPGRRFEGLTAISNAAALRPSPELRNEAIACTGLFDVRVGRQWRPDHPGVPFWGRVFDAGCTRYAEARTNGEVVTRQVQDHTETARLPGLGAREYAALCFSPNGRFLAESSTGRATNYFRVWDLERGQAALCEPDHVREPGQIAPSIAFARDSSWVARGQSNSVLLYDLTGRPGGRTLPVGSVPFALSFSPDGGRLAVCFRDSARVQVFDLRSQQLQQTLEHPSDVTWVDWSPDGQRLACSATDSHLYLWDWVAGLTNRVLVGHTSAAMTVLFHPGGEVLVSTSWDGSTRFWDVLTGEQLLSVPDCLSPFSAFNPERPWLGFGEEDRRAGCWEIAPTPTCRHWPAPTRPLGRGTLDPTGRMLVTLGTGGAQFWDPTHRKFLGLLPLTDCREMALHPGGQTLFICGERGLHRIPLALDPVKAELRIGSPAKLWSAKLERLSLTPDGQVLAASTRASSEVLVFNLDDPTKPIRLNCLSLVNAVSLSPDHRWVAAAPWDGTTLRVLEVASGRLLQSFPVPRWSTEVAFSPDGQRLVASDPLEHRLWQTGSWGLIATLPKDHAAGMTDRVVLSPDSRMAALLQGRSQGLILLALDSGRELATIDQGRPLCFSTDNTQLAAYNEDTQRLMVWDLRRVRQALAPLKLDWEAPPYPPPPTNPMPPELHLALGSGKPLEPSRGPIPPRDPLARPEWVDLSRFYNAALTDRMPSGSAGNDLAELPTGVQPLGGVNFDLRGRIQLYGSISQQKGTPPYPPAATGLPLHRKLAHLHFLYGTDWTEKPGLQVASFVLHYADGRTQDLPLIYGQDILGFWNGREAAKLPKGRVTLAWSGQNQVLRGYNTTYGQSHRLGLLHLVWDNPRPEVALASLDFISARSACAPFLIALTVE